MKPRIYIAGPITKGDRAHNRQQASDAQYALILAGFAPANPILTMDLPYAWDIPHEVWMECDLPWVLVADAILRLPGESTGADEEVAFAVQHGIRVYTDIDSLIADKDVLHP